MRCDRPTYFRVKKSNFFNGLAYFFLQSIGFHRRNEREATAIFARRKEDYAVL